MDPTAAVPLWERQFDPALDFPERAPTIRLALCGAPRCGSHLLGHALAATGAFGRPLEYFNPLNLPRWEARASEEGDSDVMAFLERRRTSANGVFAVKLFMAHLDGFERLGGDLRGYVAVLLRRRDVVAQAVSYEWAAQSGSWISEMPERRRPRYDADAIAARLTEVLRDEARWRALLAALGAPTLLVDYEDLAGDVDGAAVQVAAHCGLPAPAPAARSEFVPARQSAGDKRDWATRFRADLAPDGRDTGRILARLGLDAARPGPVTRARGIMRRMAGALRLKR